MIATNIKFYCKNNACTCCGEIILYLFVSGTSGGNGHSWWLVKYYLLTDTDVGIPSSSTDIHPTASVGERRYKARLDSVGQAIRDSYIARKGKTRFEREVLGGLAHEQLGGRWLWSQLQILAEEAQQQEPQFSFDQQDAWKALGADANIHELLYLLRLLWTSQTYIYDFIPIFNDRFKV